MFRSMKEFIGYQMENTDGSRGEIYDFLFSDLTWRVKHIEVDLGQYLPGDKVLIEPSHLGKPERNQGSIPSDLKCEEVGEQPRFNEDRPVSEQWEKRLSEVTTGGRGDSMQIHWMGKPFPTGFAMEDLKKRSLEFDLHLRSFKELCGYGIEAKDDSFGVVDDVIVNTTGWSIPGVVVCSRRWVPGKKVLITPDDITDIDWISQTVYINRDREDILSSRSFNPREPVNPGRTPSQFFDYYGRKVDISRPLSKGLSL